MPVPEAHWNQATLETRIADARLRQRYPGGSPDPVEIAAYAAALGQADDAPGAALVLGMTPELRALALTRFERLISVDANPHAIALYRNWVAPAEQERETILAANWFSLPAVLAHPVSAVLADGVFGNLPDLAAHEQLLRTIAAVLSPSGRLVTRMAMIPDDFDPTVHRADRLLTRFRARQIDEAEFGFGMRLVGHYESCYDRPTAQLDNAKIYACCLARHAASEFTDAEHAVIRRYYFGGYNCIVTQRAWERGLTAAGWQFQIHR